MYIDARHKQRDQKITSIINIVSWQPKVSEMSSFTINLPSERSLLSAEKLSMPSVTELHTL